MSTFTFKNPTTGEEVDLPVMLGDDDNQINLQELIGGVIAKGKTDAKKTASQQSQKLQQEIDKLQKMLKDETTTNEQIREQIQKMEDEKLTAEERAAKEYERKSKEWEQQVTESTNKADLNWRRFRDNKITTDIYASFAGYDLVDAEQTMILFKSSNTVELAEDGEDGQGNTKYKTVVKMMVDDEEQELSAKDAFAKWIAMPRYANQLKNNLTPGSGTDEGAGGGGKLDAKGVRGYTREELQDPKVRAEYASRLKAGEDVKILD